MKHRIGYNRLSRKTSHRKAMLRNMVTSLFEHERITTTKSKAQELRRKAEKMITKAKVDSVHNRRNAAKVLYSKEILAKLFTDIAPRFIKRPGGYTRILKTGYRQGDAAEMVIIELVERKEVNKKSSKDKKTAKPIASTTAKKPVAAKKEAEPKKEAAPKSKEKAAPKKAPEKKAAAKDEAPEAKEAPKAEEAKDDGVVEKIPEA